MGAQGPYNDEMGSKERLIFRIPVTIYLGLVLSCATVLVSCLLD